MYFNRWKIIAAAQEERFTRKNDFSYPHNAVEFVLKYAKIKLDDVDQIVFLKNLLKFERLLETYVAFAPKFFLLLKLCHYIKKNFFKNILFNKLKAHDKKSDKNFSDQYLLVLFSHLLLK